MSKYPQTRQPERQAIEEAEDDVQRDDCVYRPLADGFGEPGVFLDHFG